MYIYICVYGCAVPGAIATQSEPEKKMVHIVHKAIFLG
jgi:hypothetical protein